jgi:hypothetical protein
MCGRPSAFREAGHCALGYAQDSGAARKGIDRDGSAERFRTSVGIAELSTQRDSYSAIRSLGAPKYFFSQA